MTSVSVPVALIFSVGSIAPVSITCFFHLYTVSPPDDKVGCFLHCVVEPRDSTQHLVTFFIVQYVGSHYSHTNSLVLPLLLQASDALVSNPLFVSHFVLACFGSALRKGPTRFQHKKRLAIGFYHFSACY